MKTLILMRHAKSSWEDPYMDDFDRPLNKRGKNDAPEMGKRLRLLGMVPLQVISSPAARTAATSIKACENMNFDKNDIEWEKDLYHASASTIWEVIRKKGKENIVMVVGHNPGLNSVADSLNLDIDNIPTAGVLVVVLSIKNWSEARPEKARFDFFDYPKNKGKEFRRL
ncbi:histidine phosphatase family protein [Mangrovivirga sp. M17]|uniref:Histidine phosphatase family protein n=1 Tax=Mangrovivirga halotolerans TaxID=2993936 RepID=A0ABT3RSV4_9BACT|nr:histidine phosphatase family protein [Mangrovivirga halotolerans]MCX2744433.1 histidine phosphatase family protein [Mangrovivirga halotolerans]